MFSVTISRSLARSFAHSFVWRMFVSSHWKEGRRGETRERQRKMTRHEALLFSRKSLASVRPSVSTLSTSSTSRQRQAVCHTITKGVHTSIPSLSLHIHYFSLLQYKSENRDQVSSVNNNRCQLPHASCQLPLPLDPPPRRR